MFSLPLREAAALEQESSAIAVAVEQGFLDGPPSLTLATTPNPGE
jgi:hypothetical protein